MTQQAITTQEKTDRQTDGQTDRERQTDREMTPHKHNQPFSLVLIYSRLNRRHYLNIYATRSPRGHWIGQRKVTQRL